MNQILIEVADTPDDIAYMRTTDRGILADTKWAAVATGTKAPGWVFVAQDDGATVRVTAVGYPLRSTAPQEPSRRTLWRSSNPFRAHDTALARIATLASLDEAGLESILRRGFVLAGSMARLRGGF